MNAKQFYYNNLDDLKILYFKNNIVLSSMPHEQEALVQRAEKDGVTKKGKADHDESKNYKFDHVSEFRNKNWDENLIKQKIVRVEGHVISDQLLWSLNESLRIFELVSNKIFKVGSLSYEIKNEYIFLFILQIIFNNLIYMIFLTFFPNGKSEEIKSLLRTIRIY